MRCIVFILLTAPLGAQLQDIAGNRIKAHTKFLAADLLEGRGVGTRGGQLAEEYIATQLEIAGAKPAGDNGTYFQRVPLTGVKALPESELTVNGPGKSLTLHWLDDFAGGFPRQKTEDQFEGELVFVGHGISAPQDQWDDFKGMDVKGKVLLLFTNEPQPENPDVFKGKTLTYVGRWTYKFEEAQRRGAIGIVIIHTTPTAGYGWEVVRNSWSKEDPQVIPEPGQHQLAFTGWVTQEAGQKLLNLVGKSVETMLKAADSKDFRPIPLGLRMRGKIRTAVRRIETRNVAAIIPGSDSKLKDEVVVFTAHWDHLGVAMPVNGDAIYNGAIDNATGCGILLETARAWGALEHKPRRSALFLSVTAEESGLRGSEYYGAHPLVPVGKTAVDLNYDALFPSGATKDIVVMGAERTTLWPTVQQAARRFSYQIQPDPHPEQGSFYRSDHFSLARVGVPAFSIKMGSEPRAGGSSGGDQVFQEYNTKHYHQPSDEFHDDWDFSGIERAARFGMLIGMDAANQDKLPTWVQGDEFLPARIASGVQ
ncbi:MAG TPA: M28 family peptidase [Bryobacteraceae bacterium]|nr:M28 family peptidase [Bryobacteraceae bacterium]